MSARARGFIADWRPRPATCALLDKVQSILLQYVAQLPLGCARSSTSWLAATPTTRPSKPTNDWARHSAGHAGRG